MKNRASTLRFTARKHIHLVSSGAIKAICATALLSGSAVEFALAGQTAPHPTPTPSPTPSVAADPCGSIISIVNRPPISTGICTVQKGHFDVETGWTNLVATGSNAGNSGSYGASLVRIGTGDSQVDLEITPPNFQRATSASGTSDSSIGAKVELGYSSRWLYGVNGLVAFPTGSKAFTAGAAQYTGNFNWAYTINSVFGVNGTLGLNQLRGTSSNGALQSYFAFVPSLEATASLPGPAQIFAEYAYFSQAGSGLGSKGTIDFGYLHDFGTHLQLDAEYGITPTTLFGQRQHYIGAGLSFMN